MGHPIVDNGTCAGAGDEGALRGAARPRPFGALALACALVAGCADDGPSRTAPDVEGEEDDGPDGADCAERGGGDCSSEGEGEGEGEPAPDPAPQDDPADAHDDATLTLEVLLGTDSAMAEAYGDGLSAYVDDVMDQIAYMFQKLRPEADLNVVLVRHEADVDRRGLELSTDADELLNAWVEWSGERNVDDDDDPAHFDYSVLLTKSAFGTGWARTGVRICHPGAGSVVFDKGYIAAKVVAHETGHSFGLGHVDGRNHIMHANPGTTWRSESRAFFQEITVETDPCLEDFVRRRWVADVPVVAVADQCEATFGMPVCPQWDSDKQCDKLICAVDEWNCVWDDSPVLDGSSCGDGRWCISGQCVDEGVLEAPEPEPEPEPDDLLRNGGFEDGDDPWNVWGGAARVEGAGREGGWALRSTERNGAEQIVEGLRPNTVYRLSGWGRTEGDAPVTVGVKGYGGAEVRLAFTTAEYTQDSLTFTTGFGRDRAIIYVYKHDGPGAGYADDVSLVRVGDGPLQLVWSDEFDGDGPLAPERWTFEEGFVRNEELQWYQPDNAFQEAGRLVIEGRRESRPNPNHEPGADDWRLGRETLEYTSASVTTRGLFSWRYGRLVVRAKVSGLTGTWPAVWTLGVECEWPSNGEVDVMENYGGDLLANFAWGTDRRWSPRWDASHHAVADLGAGWVDDFHIWEFAWDEESMTILLDGDVLNSVSLAETVNGTAACEGDNPFRQPHYLLLNLALGGAGGSVDDLAFPTRYLVDYVRIYQE